MDTARFPALASASPCAPAARIGFSCELAFQVRLKSSTDSASIFALQVVQHGIAGVLGFGESFERRADDLDRATALVKRTP
jgi:hypothetical protein